jgi:hypothetical protein
MSALWSAASCLPARQARRRFSAASIAGTWPLAGLALFVSLFAAAPVAPLLVAADSYTLEKIAEAPPAELPAPLRDAVRAEALAVKGPSGVLCEIWLRKEVPVAAAPSTELGITFGQIAEGTFLGVMRIAAPTTDFRNQKIKPGVYTLRYADTPVDGNHQGVAPQRDFALLSPAAEDADPSSLTRDEAIKRSTKTTGSKHPSVWSLWPGDDSATAPALRYQSDSETWLLTFRLPLAGGTQLSIGMVVVGHAPEA